jgi:hypothetical protein
MPAQANMLKKFNLGQLAGRRQSQYFHSQLNVLITKGWLYFGNYLFVQIHLLKINH